MADVNESGYFDDGSTAVELGAATWASQSSVGRTLHRRTPPGRAARVHDAGGGVQEIRVQGGRLRDNRGDAERYAYELLTTLATSGHGTLGVRDLRGESSSYRHTWSDAVCVDAAATIEAHRWVSLDLTFRAPTRPAATTTTTAGSWPAPDPPGTYSGTSTSQDYAAGGVDLGVGGTMDLEMARSADLRTVPRARGAVPGAPWSGGSLRMVITAHARGLDQHLASRLAELERQIGATPVDLTGNGNTYADVVLERLSPDPTQWRSTAFSAEFIRGL